MRIKLLVNPIAGGGRAARCAEAAALRIERAGYACTTVPTRPGGDHAWLDRELAGPTPDGIPGQRASCDLLVVVGGDGAVRLAAGPAARHAVSIWQMPMGTENLFAREWGMDRDVDTLLRAIDRWDVTSIDLGVVGPDDASAVVRPSRSPLVASGVEPFTLMASIGFDSKVVHALAAARRGGISHWSYAAPILRTLVGHVAPTLRVEADGRRIDRGGRGFALVANGRQYAVRLNPARDASMTDGLLDVLWFPGDGVAALLGWLARCAIGLHGRSERLVQVKARAVRIESDHPFLYQLDGDAPWATGTGVGVRRLEIGVRAGVLRVLRPSSAPVTSNQ